MKISIPSVVTGTLGSLVQRLFAGVNSLIVHEQSDGFADETTIDGEAFAIWNEVAAVAAQNGHIQVFNPVSSGKFIYIDHATAFINPTAASFIRAGIRNTANTTDIGTCSNKDAGGAVSAAHVRNMTNAGLAFDAFVDRKVQNTGTHVEFIFDPPIRCGEGEGFQIATETVNVAFSACIHFRERAT